MVVQRTSPAPVTNRFHRRAAAASVVAVVAVVFATLLARPALAATAKLPVDQQAWFWSSTFDVNQCTPEELPSLPDPAPPNLCTPEHTSALAPASPITPGHLGVALKNGQSDMRSYLTFDTSNIPFGATIEAFTVKMLVSRQSTDTEHARIHSQREGKPPATTGDDRAKINACILTLPWGRAEGAPPSNMNSHDPTKSEPVEPYVRGGYDCSVSAEGRRSADGASWTFDITEIAQKWASETVFNNGIILLPQPTGPADSWTLEFHGAFTTRPVENPATGSTTEEVYVRTLETPVATVKYTAPPPEAVEPPFTPPVDTGGPLLPPITIGPPPQVPVDTGPAPQRPAAFERPESNPRTPWYYFLLFPAGLAGISGLSRAMGRELGAAPANRVAAMLRRRRAEV